MANRRSLAKSVSISDDVAKLSDFAALLFTWGIPHTDDYGIIPGSIGAIKALVVPRRKQSEEQVEKALHEIQRAGLIWRYVYKNKEYLQYVNFERHQDGLHKRTESRHPEFKAVCNDSDNFREIPGNSLLNEGKGREEKGNEGKRNVPSSSRKDVEEFADTVFLTKDEYLRLVTDFTEQGAKRLIEILDNYKTNTPKKCREYQDDNKVIRGWVLDRYKKEQPQSSTSKSFPSAQKAFEEYREKLKNPPPEGVTWSSPFLLQVANLFKWKIHDDPDFKSKFIREYEILTKGAT